MSSAIGITDMANMMSVLRQKPWLKWLLIAVSVIILALVIIADVIRPRAAAWDTKSVSVVLSEVTETDVGSLETGEITSHRLSFDYALQNNTKRDITIPESVTIMKRLKNGGVLVDYSSKPTVVTFIPAHDRARISIPMVGGCDVTEATTGKIVETWDPETCYARQFADSDELVLFDHANHLKITLPRPTLAKSKR